MSAKNFFATAIATALIGSLAYKLYPRSDELLEAFTEKGEELKNRSIDYADELIDKGLALAHLQRAERSTLSWKSCLAGLLFGTGAALLLAPKNGRDTRRQLQRILSGITATSHNITSKNHHRPAHKTQRATPYHNAETIYPVKKTRKTARTAVKH